MVFPCLYFYTGREAIRHLYRVASSLDSLVIGEPQILGQCQRRDSRRSSSRLFEHATGYAVLREPSVQPRKYAVRLEIASSAVSVSYAAVELARKIFGELKGKHVLILGAGKTSELTAKHLLNCEIQSVVVSNRTYEKAEELARRLHGKAAHFSELQLHLKEADIVISSTGAPHPILTKADVADAIKERHNRPLFLIDIAVPRDIDPGVNKLSDVFLYDIDDLAEVVGSNLKTREKAAQQAEKIVNREVELTLGSVEARSRGSEIADLRKTLDKIGQEELLKAGSRMTALSEQDRKILELMVHRIVSKISHPLVMEMKRSPSRLPRWDNASEPLPDRHELEHEDGRWKIEESPSLPFPLSATPILHPRPLKTDYLPNIDFPPWVISPCAARFPSCFPHSRSDRTATTD